MIGRLAGLVCAYGMDRALHRRRTLCCGFGRGRAGDSDLHQITAPLEFQVMRLLAVLPMFVIALQTSPLPVLGAETVQGTQYFEKHVRPLLSRRCYACHSADSEPLEGGLRLDSRAGWQAGGDSGVALVPGKPAESRLLKAVLYQDPNLAMPPDAALPKREIEILRTWIEMGAPDPRTAGAALAVREVDFVAGRKFWAFQPLRKPLPPVVPTGNRSGTPVDRFVLARMAGEGLQPVARAARQTLVRRVFLDVLGIPPTPHDASAFVADRSPDALPRLVDRLLASPHFGERWGRHWLDVARYADDQLRVEFFYRPLPHAWRYRDWVVQALNEDLPYDRFVTQQLAGDLLVDSRGAPLTVATGFLALGMIYQDDGGTPESIAVAAAETLDDRVDTVTRGLLGLTVSCARCHDHKFDPIPTEDYYSLAGVFQNARYVENTPLVSAEVVGRFERAQQAIAETEQALKVATEAKERERVAVLTRQLSQQRAAAPPGYPRGHAMIEGGKEDMRVALRGNRLKPGARVPRRFLRVVAGDEPPRFTEGSGRLELARALVGADNPLASRVIANRVWQHYFGRGIVASSSNFGVTGERPTHPLLLDWLASRLIEHGWSLKNLHRQILLSDAYQRSLHHDARNAALDGSNRWLWRMNRRRLDIEVYRDSLLAVSGELDRSMGGPAQADLFASRRRTLYGAVHRDNQTESDALLRTFDFPNARISSSGRIATTTTGQQLFALNSGFLIERARALASRLQLEPEAAEASRSDGKAVELLFQRVVGRSATLQERRLAEEFLAAAETEEANGLSSWQQLCHALLISNELLYRP